MTITHTYVDPSIDAASGAGTVGDPYGDLQHALDTVTQDATNGDQINVKAGTAEVLTAALDFSTYGVPTAAVALVIRGYTTAANDGGIGVISGGGSYSVVDTWSLHYTTWIDMHLHNSGSAPIMVIGEDSLMINCEIDNSSGNGVYTKNHVYIHNCYIHNTGGYGLRTEYGGIVINCIFENGTNDFVNAIYGDARSAHYIGNIFILDGASVGIIADEGARVINNTIYSSSGTGTGISIAAVSDRVRVMNNYIEGFSGTGGVGIETISGSIQNIIRNNRYYNNTDDESFGGDNITETDNSAVSSSALTDPGAGDFSVGTDLKAGAYPSTFKGISTDQFMDIGAAQREEPAGGGGGRRARIRAHGV